MDRQATTRRKRNPEHVLRHMKKNDKVLFHMLKEEYRLMEEKDGKPMGGSSCSS